MRNLKVILVFLCAFGLLVAVGRAATQTNSDLVKDLPQSGVTLGDQWASPEVESARAGLEQAVKEEIESGCTERVSLGGQVGFCGASKERILKLENQLSEAIRSNELQNSAEIRNGLAAVKSLSLNSGLGINFDGFSSNPFNKTGSRISFYVDENGVDYWVNTKNNEVVNIDFSKSRLRLESFPRRSKEDLREIAEAFLAEHVANFTDMKTSFSMRLLDCRNDDVVCTYRWEGSTSSNKNDMSPFVQVSVSVGGKIVGFTNTQGL